MCLAIPGKLVEFVDEANSIAKVEIGGVRRNINLGLLDRDTVALGDYVLVHVGFAMNKIDEQQAIETLRLLHEIGAYEEEVDQFKTTLD